jgi:uncharacterized phiE125 gp8 family phage protein
MGLNPPVGQSYGFGDFRYFQSIRQSEPSRNYVVVDAVDDFPLSTNQLQEHLKIDAYNAESEDYTSQLIRSVCKTAESCTRMDIQLKTYQFYAPRFNNYLELRKRPFVELVSIQTLNADNTWTTLDASKYYVTQAGLYARVYPVDSWPDLNVNRIDGIKVQFKAGYSSPTSDSVPVDLQLAMLNHAALLYEQRGDWGSADMGVAMLIQNLPSYCQLVYNSYRVTNRG